MSARQFKTPEQSVRAARKALLEATDIETLKALEAKLLGDTPLAKYRQKLRDMPVDRARAGKVQLPPPPRTG